VGVLCKMSTLETMALFLERVLPWMAAIDDCTKQEGAIEAMACIPSRPLPSQREYRPGEWLLNMYLVYLLLHLHKVCVRVRVSAISARLFKIRELY